MISIATLTLMAGQPESEVDRAPDLAWQDLSLAIAAALVGDDAYEAAVHLSRLGQPINGVVAAPRVLRRIEDAQASLDMVFDPRDEKILDQFIIVFRERADIPIPGFRGSLSNCSEAGPADCRRLPLIVRSDLTLGVAACLCGRGSWRAQLNGEPVAMVPCWLGRGASYLHVVFAFADAAGQIHRALEMGPGPAAAAICAASDAARNFPEFLAHRHAGQTGPLPAEIDANAWPVAVLAGTRGRFERDAEVLDAPTD